jgi:hypothetical protein
MHAEKTEFNCQKAENEKAPVCQGGCCLVKSMKIVKTFHLPRTFSKPCLPRNKGTVV